MRAPNNTIVFGSQNAGLNQNGPASKPLETQWFNERGEAGPSSVSFRPLSADLDERPAWLGPTDRGLLFAVVSVALIGIAAAGSYVLFAGDTRVSTAPVGTTTLTSADTTPAAPVAPAIPPPVPVEEKATAPAVARPAAPPDQPWVPPVVDAVKAPTSQVRPHRMAAASPRPAERAAPIASPEPSAPSRTPSPAATTDTTSVNGAQPAAAAADTSPMNAAQPATSPAATSPAAAPPAATTAPETPAPTPTEPVLPEVQIKR